MTEATRALVRVSAAIARGDRAALDAALAHAARAAPAGQVEEALLQCHLFVGYPAMLDAIARWRVHTPAPASAESAATDDPSDWRARGERVCATIYGGQYDRLRANVTALHPVLDGWMVADGYGRVLGREGLPLDVRELCIVALLCAQDAEPQLYAHLRGALNAGVDPADVVAAVEEAVAGLEEREGARARATWGRVRDRRR